MKLWEFNFKLSGQFIDYFLGTSRNAFYLLRRNLIECDVFLCFLRCNLIDVFYVLRRFAMNPYFYDDLLFIFAVFINPT